MNEKRICQLAIVPFILQELAIDGTDNKSKRFSQYTQIIIDRLLPKDKYDKLERRIKKTNHNILQYFTHEQKYSGHKVLIAMFYLSQMIFDEKEDIPKEEHYFMSKTKFILQFALNHEAEERYKRLESDDDFAKMRKSAEKQAIKIFKGEYREI